MGTDQCQLKFKWYDDYKCLKREVWSIVTPSHYNLSSVLGVFQLHIQVF